MCPLRGSDHEFWVWNDQKFQLECANNLEEKRFFSFFDTERNELKSKKQRSKVSKQKVEDKLDKWQLQKDPPNHSKSELIKNSSKMDFKSGVTKVIVVVQ